MPDRLRPPLCRPLSPGQCLVSGALLTVLAAPAYAQEVVSTALPTPPAPPAPQAYTTSTSFEQPFKLYGYINSFYEKVGRSPAVSEEGDPVVEPNPGEFDVVNFNVMGQGALARKYRYYFNLASPGSGSPTADAPLLVRGAMVEAPIAGEYLKVSAGKMYRRFGIYNEMLDATVSFIGTTDPEMLDDDHLILTRSTNLMLHGKVNPGGVALRYAITTGNDERESNQVPLGLDFNALFDNQFTVGTSFYTTNGKAVPTVEMGEGSPLGGVLPWMEYDEYYVYGGYMQVKGDAYLLQGEYWRSPHSGRRDPDKVLQLFDPALGLNAAQRERFGFDTATSADELPLDVNYTVEAFYLRLGVSLHADLAKNGRPWEFTPYAQFDYYSNPETIANKDLGGDNEAGLADDGKFYKGMVGLMVKPTTTVAFKVDGSTHFQTISDEMVPYSELHVSASYYWQMGGNAR